MNLSTLVKGVRRLAWVLLIVSTFSLVACQQAYALPASIPDSNMLEVPFHAQETDYYCCVASVQMALHYISGDVIPQEMLAKELATTEKGTYTNMMSKPFHKRGYGVGGNTDTTLDELKRENSRGYVSIIAIWWDMNRKNGHCVLVVGYNETGIFVNDPNPREWIQPISRRTGERAFISNKLLSNLWVYYEKWALEIPHGSSLYWVRLSLAGLGQNYQSLVDTDVGQSYWIKNGKLASFYFKIATMHTITAERYVYRFDVDGVRYYAPENVVTVTKQGSHVIEYIEQHRLLVETITGTSEEWLVSDQTVTLGPYDEIVPVDTGTRYFFAGLRVDGIHQDTRSATLFMDQPHTVAVEYYKQYYLKVDSEFGDPKGEDWYTSGDVAAYSVTTPQGFLIRHVFVLWTGDASSTQPQGTVTMAQSYTIEAEWRTDYRQFALVALVVVIIAGLVVTAILAMQPRKRVLPS